MDMDKIAARARALKNMTTDRGCSEAEAMAAADKLASLLSDHDLDPALLDESAETLTEAFVDQAEARSEFEKVAMTIAYYTGCTSYLDQIGARSYRQAYFGEAVDVQIALYLHALLKRAVDFEIGVFKESMDYKRRRKTATRRASIKAFRQGMCERLALRLFDMHRARNPEARTVAELQARQTALRRVMPRKEGLETVRPLDGKTRRDTSRDRLAGRAAANKVGIHEGLTSDAAPGHAQLTGGQS